jgi:hypothetical protein
MNRRVGCAVLVAIAVVSYGAVIALADLAVQQPDNTTIQLGLGAAIFPPIVAAVVIALLVLRQRRGGSS